jgi:hypothetical protein
LAGSVTEGALPVGDELLGALPLRLELGQEAGVCGELLAGQAGVALLA